MKRRAFLYPIWVAASAGLLAVSGMSADAEQPKPKRVKHIIQTTSNEELGVEFVYAHPGEGGGGSDADDIVFFPPKPEGEKGVAKKYIVKCEGGKNLQVEVTWPDGARNEYSQIAIDPELTDAFKAKILSGKPFTETYVIPTKTGARLIYTYKEELENGKRTALITIEELAR